MSQKYPNYVSYTIRLNTDYPEEAKLNQLLIELIDKDKKEHGKKDGGLRRMFPAMVESYTNERAKVKPLTPERRLERLLVQSMEGLEQRLINNILENIASIRPGLLTRIDQGEPAIEDGDSDVISGAFLDALTGEFEGST
jgi:hypothetical protein